MFKSPRSLNLNTFKRRGGMKEMDPKLAMYLGYLTISMVLTAWVSRSLYRNGQVFLEDALGNERLAPLPDLSTGPLLATETASAGHLGI
jgi:hypothetical protein